MSDVILEGEVGPDLEQYVNALLERNAELEREVAELSADAVPRSRYNAVCKEVGGWKARLEKIQADAGAYIESLERENAELLRVQEATETYLIHEDGVHALIQENAALRSRQITEELRERVPHAVIAAQALLDLADPGIREHAKYVCRFVNDMTDILSTTGDGLEP